MNCKWSNEDILKKAKDSASGPGRDIKNNAGYTFLWEGGHCTLNAAQLKRQDGIPLHIHKEHDEVIHVYEGEGEVIVGKESQFVRKGDICFVPKGVPHCLKFACVILSVYAPAFDPGHPDREFV